MTQACMVCGTSMHMYRAMSTADLTQAGNDFYEGVRAGKLICNNLGVTINKN